MKEAYCSYEISEILKEKGFDEPIKCWYDNFADFHEQGVKMNNTDCLPPTIMCPTHQMACAWLRKKHNILISIIPQEVKVGVDELCYAIYRITEDVYTPLYNGYINNLVDSYEDTVESAIKYCLENLI